MSMDLRLPTLRAEHTPTTIRIFRNAEGVRQASPSSALKAAQIGTGNQDAEEAGGDEPVLVQHLAADKRAYIHPIYAPDGKGELTENEPGHHLWQHGLYVGLNDVNGVGFWTEGLNEKNRASDGTFHTRMGPRPPMVRLWGDHTRAAWEVFSEWRASTSYTGDGGPRAPLLIETQTWCLQDRSSYFLLDLTWRLEALQDLTFGHYPYGGLFLRMPYRKDAGGVAVNSEGSQNDKAEAQKARWVSVSMAIPGRTGRGKQKSKECGIAMLDHPSNPEHPVPWRVDGQLGISPSRCIANAWTLKKGMTTTSRYRLYIFTGPTDPAAVNTQWTTFAKEEM